MRWEKGEEKRDMGELRRELERDYDTLHGERDDHTLRGEGDGY